MSEAENPTVLDARHRIHAAQELGEGEAFLARQIAAV